MLADRKEIWILNGYTLFAKEGIKGLKIEVMAKNVKKNKSSFYHHFADMECFTELLLKYHLERAKIIAVKENNCKSIDPELINVLIEAKEDLFFNRQLRVNREIFLFRQCFEQANSLVGEAFLKIWTKDVGLEAKPKLAEVFLGLILENFYLQITDEVLNAEWLSAYFKNIRNMVMQFSSN
jgi:AcrR family transcriptional regulator